MGRKRSTDKKGTVWEKDAKKVPRILKINIMEMKSSSANAKVVEFCVSSFQLAHVSSLLDWVCNTMYAWIYLFFQLVYYGNDRDWNVEPELRKSAGEFCVMPHNSYSYYNIDSISSVSNILIIFSGHISLQFGFFCFSSVAKRISAIETYVFFVC